jgi:hypothetical protein
MQLVGSLELLVVIPNPKGFVVYSFDSLAPSISSAAT